MIMAKIYKTDGDVCDIEPNNGTDFQLEELQKIVGGFIEIADLRNGQIMIINEEGKIMSLPYNERATELYRKKVCKGDFIAGDVLICKSEEVR